VSDKSAIEWTDATWNPVRGCDKVSAGCKNCYAETFSERWRGIPGHPFEQGFDLRLVPEALAKPLLWKRGRKIFVNSMSDLFHEGVPFEYVAAVFGVMAACQHHTFQVLTKRSERALEFFGWLDGQRDSGGGRWNTFAEVCRHFALCSVPQASLAGGAWAPVVHPLLGYDTRWPLPNVQLGVSCEDQENADLRIPDLRLCPATVRFVSAEPLLGPIDLRSIPANYNGAVGDMLDALSGCEFYDQDEPSGKRPEDPAVEGPAIDWVIVGGESGPGARVCDLGWIRSIVLQCKAAGVPVFVKQVGAAPLVEMGEQRPPRGVRMWRQGLAQRLIYDLEDSKGGDMAEWPEELRVRQFPQVSL
jgi:protein gp37